MGSQTQKNNLGLAGEYRVLSELLLKGYHSTLTMGNAKGTDILIFDDKKKFIRVEVKTSKNGRNFVTSFFPKYSSKSFTDPDIWVLFLPSEVNKKIKEDTFFILSHSEVKDLQLIMNKGKETKRGEGVDNISFKLLKSENVKVNQWGKFEKLLNEI